MTIPKLYLVVREDLPFEQQAVQAAHALQEFNMAYPEKIKVWFEKSNTLVLLSTSNEASLGVIVREAERRGVQVACFREPDRNNELTAIALAPEGKALTRKLPALHMPI